MISFPPVKPGEDIRVSASSFVAFYQCPERAGAHYRRVFSPDSKASFRGGLAHRLFARHLGQGEIQPGEFEQICREEIGSSNLNHKVAALGLKPSSLGSIIEELGLIYERFKRLPTEGFDSAEVFFDIEPAAGVNLIGQVDAVFVVDDGFKLVDWKTGALGEAARQLGFYALLWALEKGELPARVEALSVGTGEQYSEIPSRRDVETTAADVAGMIDELRDVWENSGTLDRRGGPWCRFCPVLEGCEEGASAAEVADLT